MQLQYFLYVSDRNRTQGTLLITNILAIENINLYKLNFKKKKNFQEYKLKFHSQVSSLNNIYVLHVLSSLPMLISQTWYYCFSCHTVLHEDL